MKGVSQVLGSALLLAVAVTVAGIYASFAPGLAERAGGQVAEGTRSDIKCSGASVDLRGLEYTTGDLTRFEIANTGTVDVRAVSVFAVNSSQELLNSTEIGSLQADESRNLAIVSRTRPAYVTVSVEECPSIQTREGL